MRRKEVFPFGEGQRKKERLRTQCGDAASGRRASRTSAPEAGGGRAGRTAYQSSQGVGPALGSEARRSQVFGGSTTHRPWNTESSRTRTTYGSGTGSNDTHPRSEFSLGETPKRQETTPGYGSANKRGKAARRTGTLEGTKLTLKNQGYWFEHNHGKKNLSTVFALMLAFLLNSDVASWQAQMKTRRSSCFREKVRGLFLNCFLKDWETLCVRASSGNSHNHRRDRVCRSRFFRGNRIVKAMSAPGRRGRGGSRRLALWQRCCLDAPSANVGPLAGIAVNQNTILTSPDLVAILMRCGSGSANNEFRP